MEFLWNFFFLEAKTSFHDLKFIYFGRIFEFSDKISPFQFVVSNLKKNKWQSTIKAILFYRNSMQKKKKKKEKRLL